jgi:hypothetical protein
MVGDEKPLARFFINHKFGMVLQEFQDRDQRPRPQRGEQGQGVNRAVLNEHEASRRDQRAVELHFLKDVLGGVIAVQDHQDRRPGLPRALLNRLDDDTVRRAADQELDPRVHLLDIDRDDAPVSHQVEQMGVEQGQAAAVGPALDEQGRFDLADRFLNDPQVEDVLPDRMPQPGDRAEVLGLGHQVAEGHLPVLLQERGFPVQLRPNRLDAHGSLAVLVR